MLRQIIPRLRRSDVVFNSFSGGVSNAPKELSWTPKMSFSEVVPQPRMLMQELKGRIALKQLKSLTNTHCWRQLNKEMDMVNSNVELVDFTSISDCNFIDEPLTINFDSIKFKGVPSIFRFPDKMESILSEGVFKTLQIHFSSPEDSSNYLQNLVQEGNINPLSIEQLNINKEDGNSSLCLKAEVSLPWM